MYFLQQLYTTDFLNHSHIDSIVGVEELELVNFVLVVLRSELNPLRKAVRLGRFSLRDNYLNDILALKLFFVEDGHILNNNLI